MAPMHVVAARSEVEKGHNPHTRQPGLGRRESIKLHILIVCGRLQLVLGVPRVKWLTLAWRASWRLMRTGGPRATFKMLS